MIEQTHEITTPDGVMTTFVVHPERDGPHPVILFFMDAPAIREELRDMARRLATVGYYVMLPNLYHRAGVMEIGDLNSEDVRTRMTELMYGLTIPMVMTDSDALLAFADQDAAAGKGPAGCLGYCMSGQFSINAAARPPPRPDRSRSLALRDLSGHRQAR
jgi:carboxymethylenebutenolidase